MTRRPAPDGAARREHARRALDFWRGADSSMQRYVKELERLAAESAGAG